MILQSTALQLNGRNLASNAHPSQGGSTRPEQRRSIYEWIRERASQHRSGRDNRSANLALGDLRHCLNWQEGESESAYRTANISDRFPCFSRWLWAICIPHKFKPSNYSKYNGKIEPWQWLRMYSTAIKPVGGNNDIKGIFMPMALEPVPPQWFDKLWLDSMDSWEGIQRMFAKNFSMILTRASIRHEAQEDLEERTRERFSDRNRQENRGNDHRGNQGGQFGRRRGLDNTIALMEKPRNTSKPRRFEDLLSQPCPFHKTPSTCRRVQTAQRTRS